MGKNIVEKILREHLKVGEYKPGQEIGIRIDQTLTQDATGTMAYLQFEAIGLPRVKTDLSVSYVDHNTVQIGFENADDHRYLQTVAAKYGVLYSRAGNGICHQVHLERFGKPGTTLLGSDSHTPTGGGIGQIAIGAGGLDVALAMGGDPFYLNAPKVIKINLTGQLRPWVSAKDVVLKMLEIFTVKGNVGVIMEYGGPGVETLSVPERATITNMGAEMGVTTSIFPSDKVTKKFLKAQGRVQDYKRIKADKTAKYFKVVDLDLSTIEPLAATPHSPGNIATVKSLGGIEVNQVCIGSCTNSSFRDMMIIAKLLKGKHIHPNTSAVMAAGSKQVLTMLADNGALTDMISAGVRIAENACGFCIGNSQSPQSKGVTVRTSNRNFEARSGTKDALAYLVSPETAAAAMLTGKLIDPRELGVAFPEVKIPSRFIIDDSMVLQPAADPASVKLYRGPNIGEPPKNDRMPENVVAEVTLKVGDKITTDHIIPAGARMKYRSNVPKYSEFLFEMVDPKFYERAMAAKKAGKFNVIVGGLSYGQGSSREHAALCPMYVGVKAVISKSFERIHSANLINFGILPLTFANEADYDRIAQGDELEIHNIPHTIKSKGKLMVRDKTKNFEFEAKYELTDRQAEIVLAGGMLAKLKGA
jgi:aconitate hydratase